MKYQLVLQFPASSISDYDAMIELEEKIMQGLGDLGEVDGHDAGAAEMNVFILTDQPEFAFERVKDIVGTKDFMPDLKAAYREVGTNEYTILYPEGLTRFSLA
jgi:hypothetical protein